MRRTAEASLSDRVHDMVTAGELEPPPLPDLVLRLQEKLAGDPDVDERMDITDIQHPDHSFDVIYCSHVLEHVPDDRAAMREFHRTLDPGGWAVLNVPINADRTFEDPSVTDPQERLLQPIDE